MKTILVDFDGPIHQYSKGWQDGVIYDPPVKNVQNSLRALITLGYHVMIFSTRCNDEQMRSEMKKYLDNNEIPYSSIYDGKGKPLASLIIDDNCIRFDKPWDSILSESLRYLNKV